MARAVFVERCPMISHWWQVFLLAWGLLAAGTGLAVLVDAAVRFEPSLMAISLVPLGMGSIALWRTVVRRREIRITQQGVLVKVGLGPARDVAWSQVRRVRLDKAHEMATTWPLNWWTAWATFWTVADIRFELNTGKRLRFRSREPAKCCDALAAVVPPPVKREGRGWALQDWK